MPVIKAGSLARILASAGFMMGLALMHGGAAQSICEICNGQPATHTWLDASGQYGPALIDDTIDAHDGNDYVCGRAGDDSIAAGDGGDAVRGDTGDDVLIGTDDASEKDRLKAGEGFDICLFSAADQLTAREY